MAALPKVLSNHADYQIGGGCCTSRQNSGGAQNAPINDQLFIKTMVEICGKIILLSKEISADLTSMAASRLLKILESLWKPTYGDLSAAFNDIDNRLRDELSMKNFISLSSKETEYFDPREPLFGHDFASRFCSDGIRIG